MHRTFDVRSADHYSSACDETGAGDALTSGPGVRNDCHSMAKLRVSAATSSFVTFVMCSTVKTGRSRANGPAAGAAATAALAEPGAAEATADARISAASLSNRNVIISLKSQ